MRCRCRCCAGRRTCTAPGTSCSAATSSTRSRTPPVRSRSASSAGQPDAPMLYAGQLLMIRFDQGNLGELEQILEQQLLDNPGHPGVPRRARARAVRRRSARRSGPPAPPGGSASGSRTCPTTRCGCMCIGIWASVTEIVGDAEAADAIYELMLPWSGQVLSTGAHVFGACDHWLGALATDHRRPRRRRPAPGASPGAARAARGPVWSLRTQLARAALAQPAGHAGGDRAEAELLARRGPHDGEPARAATGSPGAPTRCSADVDRPSRI